MENNTPMKANKPSMQEYSLTSSSSLLGLANELTKFIKDKKLYTKIRDGYYVYVEAWTFAGVATGMMPIVSQLENQSTESEIKYRCTVDLLNIHTNQIVGRGIAICSNKESRKRTFDEYAIASMAQTRATGKAYRLPLGWLMKAAGYEATPAEEMDFTPAEVVQIAPAVAKPAPRPVEMAQPDAEAAALDAEQKAITDYATAKQKEEIIRLLNNECISNQEKTQMLVKVNSLTAERAKISIAKLKATIEDRTGKPVGIMPHKTQDPATLAQREFIQKLIKSHVFTEEEREEATLKCESDHFSIGEAADYISQIEQAMKSRKADEKAAA